MNQRHRHIMKLLKENKKMSVKALSEKLYVCEMTIRRDLKELEADGHIQRYNGGAIIFNEEQAPVSDRKLLYSEEKAKIAGQAAEYVKENMTVFIDSSSTCMQIIPYLADKKGLIVVTNSIQNLNFASHYHIPAIIIGGNYYEKDMCTVGNIAIEMLQSINIDVAFFSSLAISEDGLISDHDELQTAVRKAVMKRTDKSIFLFTKSKQNRKSTYTVCHSDMAFKIICEGMD